MAVAAATPLIASAANTDNFTGTSGQDWNTADHWNTVLVPGTGDTVNITLSPASAFSVVFDGNYTSPTEISALTVDGSSTVGVSLNQGTAGDNLFAVFETIGNTGIGTFNQTAAGNSVANDLVLGENTTGQGTYLLGTGANLSAGVTFLGLNGSGTFRQTGGTATIGILYDGDGTGTSGLYSLSATGTLAVSGSEYVGFYGAGSFVQSGGAHTSSTWIYVGYSQGGKGSYTLSGGTLSPNQISVGYSGVGTFAQMAGIHSITNFLTVGDQSTGSGLYTLSGGSLTAPSENIAYSGAGTFIQTGGINTPTNLVIASQPLSVGSYSLSGNGFLSISGTETIGSQGTGRFTQTGGANSGGYGQLLIAASTGSVGIYNLSGGNATFQSATVGGAATAGGIGTLNVSNPATVLTVVGELGVFNNGSSISFTGGTISVADVNTHNAPANFVWTGGTLNLTSSSVVLDSTASGTSASFGSALTLNSGQSLQLTNGSETIGGNGVGALTLNSGSSNSVGGATMINPLGTVTLSGGTLNTSGTLTNNGQITLAGGGLGASGQIVSSFGEITGYGTIGGSGGFANASELAQSGGPLTLSNTGSNTNTGNIDLAVGNQLQLTGGSLANSGTINLNGATITGSATLNNSVGGVISGKGAITVPLTNSGIIALSDGTLNLPAFTNNGTIAPNGVTANITGGAISNALNIEGFGQITNNITIASTGMIAPLGGHLTLNGTVTNSAGGLITASTGNELDLSQGLGTNAGLISLTGGTVNTNNIALTNAGSISGYGVLRAGGLTNNSQITFTGGTATVNGAITNTSGATLSVEYSTALFNGPVTNNAGGTVKTISGNTVWAGGFTNNGTLITDPSTNVFTDLVIGSTGSISASAGDQYLVSGNFINNSTQTGTWNTSGATLTFQGGVSHQLSVAGSVGQFGWGTLQVNAGDTVTVNGNSATAAATVNNGSLSHVSGTSNLGTLSGTGSLSVGNATGAAASVTVSSFSQSAISVNATGTLAVAHNAMPVVDSTNSLAIAPGGKLDLANNALMIHYAPGFDPLSTIVGYLASGYDNGKWDGSGIISSTAAANPLQTTAIAYVDSADGLVPGLPADTIELKYTLYGDTGLTGSVGFTDFMRMTQHFTQSSGATWDEGDFNYDGSVNFADFALLKPNYGTSLGATIEPAEIPAMSTVPEPSSVMLGLAGICLLRRQRRPEKHG